MNVTLPWPPSALSPNARQHWSALARAKKAYRAACAAHAPAWKYFPPAHTCPKHKPAKEAVVAARTVWLAKMGVTA